MTLPQRKITATASGLLEWFPKHARDLPWRRTTDPYGVFISEVMLQQTQVSTVIPYWERWMRALPDISALARARPETVLKLWEGLGYYTRARNLHRAARLLADQNGGRFPETYAAVLALPGIGRYTAGAICSIAFNQPTPVLDGNVMRVLTRLFALAGDPRTGRTQARLWELAGQLVESAAGLPPALPLSFGKQRLGNCSMLNQALMELGATVCTPQQPRCEPCPLRRLCAARKLGRTAQFPELAPRQPATALRMAAFVIEHRGRRLLRQRPEGVLNAHLWELPNAEWKPGEALEKVFAEALKITGGELCKSQLTERIAGCDADVFPSPRPSPTGRGRSSAPLPEKGCPSHEFACKPASTGCGEHSALLVKLGIVRHSITRYRICVEAFCLQLKQLPAQLRDHGRWMTKAEQTRLPLVSAHRKVLEKWGNGGVE